MATLIPTAILLVFLAGDARTGGSSYGEVQWRAEVSSSGNQQSESLGSLLEAVQATSRGGSRQDRILQTVFVVPGPNLAPERMAEISEDLTVMCRILDKAAVWVDRIAASEIDIGVPIDISGVEISDHWVGTQSLYLDGYGAIFFVPVNFPLSAPPQEPTPAETESSGDPVWSRTADELRGVPQQAVKPADRQYDARKVENLKTALIATLRHATNVRTRRPQDVITIVISSRTEQTTVNEMLQRDYLSRYEAVVNGRPVTPAAELPSVLILRTTKSDVDALAQGNLSQEQFAGKVQILKSWTTSSLEPVPVNTARPRLVVPQPNRW